MKIRIQFVLSILAALFASHSASAQTLSVLTNFQGGNGANPQAALVSIGSAFYGTTYNGGSSNAGTIFSITTNAGSLTTLYNFTGGNDGRGPVSDLVLYNGLLYGTASMGGASGNGVIFGISTNGSGMTNIHSFIGGNDGADPEAGLALMNNTLFGVTFIGGTSGDGEVFRINTDGSALTNLHNFTGGTNGASPQGNLLLTGNTLYGTTYGDYYGGSGTGTVYKVNTDGTGFATLHVFANGADGANPMGNLVLSGATLYGTASAGGTYANGTIFSVNTNGTNFHSYPLDYSSGANPEAGLLLNGTTLYGTAYNGGSAGWGSVFKINLDGSGLSPVYSFTDAADGNEPEAALIAYNGVLYGTTEGNNGYGSGNVFALTVSGLAPALGISLTGSQVTITWTNSAYTLQYDSRVNGAFTNIAGSTSPYVTNVTAKQQFFRLKSN